MIMYSTSYWKINIIYQEGTRGIGAEIWIAEESKSTENIFYMQKGNMYIESKEKNK